LLVRHGLPVHDSHENITQQTRSWARFLRAPDHPDRWLALIPQLEALIQKMQLLMKIERQH